MMKHKTARFALNNLFILLLVVPVIFSLAAPGTASAATINVPADFATIQEAINAATQGDTINVAAGTYAESLVIDKGLILHGAAGATIHPATGPGIQVDVSTQTYPVTIDGFTITPQDSTADTAQGIVIGSVAAPAATYNVTISNNSITTLGVNMGILVRGVGTNGPGYPNCTGLTVISNNITVGGDSTAFYASWVTPAHTGWTIIGNTFNSPVGVNLELYDVEDVLIDNNTFQAAGSGGSGNVFVSAELSNLSLPIVFSNNDVLGNGAGTMVAFNCNMQTAGTSTMNGVTITGNTFDNWVTAGRALGIFPRVTDVAIHQNNFLGTATEIGLRNTNTGSVNATLNWWGHASGPSHDGLTMGAGILESPGDIVYMPWLTAATTTIPALAITTASLPSAALHEPYSYSLAATGGTPSYHWFAYSGFPAWLSISEAGVLTGTPATAGPFDILVQVRDANQGTWKALRLYVTTTPLTITTTSPLPGGDRNYAYSQTLHASGGSGSYIWSIVGGSLPPGLSITDNVTGVISGTPTTGGDYPFTVQVDDGWVPPIPKDLSITIYDQPINIDQTSLPSGNIGSPYSQTLTATGGTGIYTWTVVNGTLPTGLTITTDNNTGVISGTPNAVNTYNFTVRVSDGYATDDQALSIVIGVALLNITTTSLPEADTGLAYSQTVVATGGTGSYAWSVVVPGTGTLPPGLTLTPATGVISGTPTTAGNFPFTVRVNDGVSTDDQPLSITVIYVQKLLGADTGTAPAPGSGTLPNYLVMARYQSIASGDLIQIRVRCINSGNVKAALYSDNTTPTVPVPGTLINANNTGAPVTSGWNNITLPTTPVTESTYYWIVVNSTANCISYANVPGSSISYVPYSYSENFTTTIAPASTILSDTQSLVAGWGMAVIAPLAITTTSLADGADGTAYSQTLTATGGTHSYTWSLLSGTLPPGLNLTAGTGLISGTPTTGGLYPFTAKVDDGVATDNRSLSIHIIGQQILVGTSTSGTGTVGPSYINLSKFVATRDGNLTQIRVYGTAAGNVKVAVYADSTGEPGTLLAANNNNNPVIAGQWNSIATDNVVAVTSGTAYWLGALMDTTNAVTKVVSPNPFRYAPRTYIQGWPSTLPSLSTSDTIYLCIAGWGPPGPLIITTTSPMPGGYTGVAYSQTLHAIGGTGSYTWSIPEGSLPDGLSLTPSTGLISGAPTVANTFDFTAQVNDGATTDNQTLSITISVALDKLIGADSSSGGAISASYINLSRFIASSNGTVSQIRVFGTAAGNVKVAIYADSGGEPGALIYGNSSNNPVLANQWNTITITDTPVTASTPYWLAVLTDTNSAVTKVVTDNPYRYKSQDYSGYTWEGTLGGLSTSNTIYLCVAGWGTTAPIPLNIITTSPMPGGAVGTAYSQTLQATGGTGSYTWSIVGTLPDGLLLTPSTGLISGTPTVANTFNFTAHVDDGVSTDDQPLSITITPAALKLVGTDTAGSGIIGASYVNLSRFVATADGTVNQIRVYGTNPGNVKVAIYADSGGEPGALLNANNSNNPVLANQWNNITIADTPVTTSTPYWLGIITDTQSAVTKVVSPNPYRYKFDIYYIFNWPTTLTGLSASDTVFLSIAGWHQ